MTATDDTSFLTPKTKRQLGRRCALAAMALGVLAPGWEKQSEGETTAGLIFQADPLWERATMSGAIGSFAGSATAYMHKYGITEEQAAKVGTKLLFPLILCIFPGLLFVLVGPAVLQMVTMFMSK